MGWLAAGRLPGGRGARVTAAGLGLALLAGGCGSVAGRTAAAAPAAPAPLSLRTSVQGAGATWATVPMGAASGADQFWQLFVLPSGGSPWFLRTPPNIATNGAIVLAAPDATGGSGGAGGTAGGGGAGATGKTGGETLVAGVRPSLDLGFSPITSTSDQGRNWTTSPPQSGLANVPDALAAAPGGGLIGLGRDGAVSVTGRRRQLGDADDRTDAGLGPGRPGLWPERAYRRRLHAGRDAAAGRDLRAGRARGRVRGNGRDVAADRPGAAVLVGGRAGRTAGARAAADPER